MAIIFEKRDRSSGWFVGFLEGRIPGKNGEAMFMGVQDLERRAVTVNVHGKNTKSDDTFFAGYPCRTLTLARTLALPTRPSKKGAGVAWAPLNPSPC